MQDNNEKNADEFKSFLNSSVSQFITETGISQREFAKFYGTDETTISSVIAGRRNADFAKFCAAVHALGYNPIIYFDPPRWIFTKADAG